MKVKILSYFIIVLLLSIIIIYPIKADTIITSNSNSIGFVNNNGEVLDQYQLDDIYKGYPLGEQSDWLAQEFKPTLNVLTKVDLHMFKKGTIPDDLEIIVMIRDRLSGLQGEDLAIITKTADEIPNSQMWVEFDFQDINVTPENTYYIIVRSEKCTKENHFCWFFNINNSYDRGDAWRSFLFGSIWHLVDYPPEYPQCDFSFKTYGLDKPPNPPEISGETEGIAGEEYNYTFLADDPEGHDVYYYIDWGDDHVEEWIGPYSSGEDKTVRHTWSEQGTYEIKTKAKDIYDVESDWTTLEVTMPRNKPIMTLFESRFPRLYRLLFPFSEPFR